MKVGFIVPSLVGEAGSLLVCVANLLTEAAAVAELEPTIIVCVQGDGPLPNLPISGSNAAVILLRMPALGVSAARNKALSLIEDVVDAIMFVDVNVRPGRHFLTAALAILLHESVVSGPVAFMASQQSEGSDRVERIAFRQLVFRGFVWSTLFRAEMVRGLRFNETIGPGTLSHHQAGEDSRFLFEAWKRSGLHWASWLPTKPVARLPRSDLPEKIQRYAWGQGWLVGNYMLHSYTSWLDRPYFCFRALLFLANSVRMLGAGATRQVAWTRLKAFIAGATNKDPTAPRLFV